MSEDYSDEGFDSYDDESFDQSDEEMKAIIDATKKKNEEALSRPSSAEKRRGEEKVTSKKRTPASSFSGAAGFRIKVQQERSSNAVARDAQMQRVTDLTSMIQIEEETHDIFELNKMTPLDFYLREVKSGAVKQSQQQTNDDAREVALQTDRIEKKSFLAQVPDDLGFNAGNASGSSFQLANFVTRAAVVCEAVLDASSLHGTSLAEASNGSNFSARVSKCTLPADIYGERCALDICFSYANVNVFLVAYNRPTWAEKDTMLREKGLLCLWDAKDLTKPQKTLMCEGEVTCCCISPDRSQVVIAGTDEGTIYVWDLREPNSYHVTVKSRKAGITGGVRRPSYLTDCLKEQNHHSKIIQIVTLAGGGKASSSKGIARVEGRDLSKISFQMASLDNRGQTIIWSMVELSKGNPSGSEADLGLGIGSKLKLIRTANITDQDFATAVGPKATTLLFYPNDAGSFMIGGVDGTIRRKARFDKPKAPTTFESPRFGSSTITTMEFSPFHENLFLVGCANGDLILFHSEHTAPLMKWPAFMRKVTGKGLSCVKRVLWSPTRPSVFFVLEELKQTDGKAVTVSHNLQIWDLLRDGEDPIVVESVSISGAPVTNFSVSRMTRLARQPFVAIVDANGSVAVHALSAKFVLSPPQEVAMFDRFVDGIPLPDRGLVVPEVVKPSRKKATIERETEGKDADDDEEDEGKASEGKEDGPDGDMDEGKHDNDAQENGAEGKDAEGKEEDLEDASDDEEGKSSSK